MLDRLRPLLLHPRLPWLAALLAVVLTLPALWTGWSADDWYHRSIALGLGDNADLDPITQLFSFFDGGERNALYAERGLMAWWAAPGLRVQFLRPLSALTHVVDYTLWPDVPLLHHAHSLLWAGLGVGLVGVLLRRLLPPEAALAAGLAAVLYAVEDAHAMPTGWLANRNAWVAVSVGVLAVLAHDHWRRGGGLLWMTASLALLAAALLAGESAVAAAGWIGAYQLAYDERPLLPRIMAIAPAAFVVAAWRNTYDGLGYGAHGSGLYIDPGAHPGDFAQAVAERWPVLMLAQWLSVPVDAWLLLPRAAQLAATVAGMSVLAGILALSWPTLRAHRAARLLALGAAVALVAPCAVFPMDRLILFSGIGGAGLLALVATRETTGWRAWTARGLLVLHLPVSAAALPARTWGARYFGEVFSEAEGQLTTDPALADQALVFLNGTVFGSVYTPVIRVVEGTHPAPARVHLLSTQLQATELLREDADTLVLQQEGGFLGTPITHLLRDPRIPFAVGDTVERVDFTAEVRATLPDGRPSVVAFHFQAPLESTTTRFVAVTDGGLIEWTPPPIGTRQRLEWVLPARSFLTAGAL